MQAFAPEGMPGPGMALVIIASFWRHSDCHERGWALGSDLLSERSTVLRTLKLISGVHGKFLQISCFCPKGYEVGS